METAQLIPQRPVRIFLAGFMGAGKSTVGPLLAHRLGWRFIDADAHLEQRTGKTIAQLFTEHGEPRFRKMESDALAELNALSGLVLALGGGAIESEASRTRIAASSGTCVIFLDAPLEVLLRRCDRQPGAAIRPVLQDRDALGRRFAARLPFYREAHITVSTHGLTPDNVVEVILQHLNTAGRGAFACEKENAP